MRLLVTGEDEQGENPLSRRALSVSKQLSIEFHELAAGEGIVDIAIRFDTKSGSYNFLIEENGLPTTLPMHVFNGIMFNIQMDACRGYIDGYRRE